MFNNKQNKQPYKWELPRYSQPPIGHGDIRRVKLEVEVLFKRSDRIVTDQDSETGEVLEHTTGYIMEVLPNQSFIHKEEDTIFIASTPQEDTKDVKVNADSLIGTARIASHFFWGQEVWFLNGMHIMSGTLESIRGVQHNNGQEGELELELLHTSGEMGAFFWKSEKDCFESREELIKALLGED